MTSIYLNAPLASAPSRSIAKPTSATRYASFDAWRGFAALWVAAHHAAMVLIKRDPGLAQIPLMRFVLVGSIRVPIFFVISGYCIAAAANSTLARGEGSCRFLSARFRRIFPTCWLALLLYMASALIARALLMHGVLSDSMSGNHSLFSNGPLFWFSNFTLTHLMFHQDTLVVVTWTLCYEVAFYLGIAGLISLRVSAGGFDGLLTLAHVGTLAIMFLQWIAPGLVHYPFDVFPQFGIGLITYDLLQRSPSTLHKGVAASILLLALALILKPDYAIGFGGQSSRLGYVVSVSFAAYLICFFRYDAWLAGTWVFRLFAAFGAFSYSLYLTHMLAIGTINQLLHKFAPSGAWYLQLGVTMAAAILIAKIFYTFCEKPFLSRRSRAVN